MMALPSLRKLALILRELGQVIAEHSAWLVCPVCDHSVKYDRHPCSSGNRHGRGGGGGAGCQGLEDAFPSMLLMGRQKSLLTGDYFVFT